MLTVMKWKQNSRHGTAGREDNQQPFLVDCGISINLRLILRLVNRETAPIRLTVTLFGVEAFSIAQGCRSVADLLSDRNLTELHVTIITY